MNPKQIYVTLWSYSQNCFHHETLSETLKIGTQCFLKNEPQDYIVIFLSPNEEERNAFTNEARRVRNQKEDGCPKI